MSQVKRVSLFVAVLCLGIAIFAPIAIRADGPIADRAGRAELRFLQGMIDHHQMALDMAADCLAKAVTPSVKTLCQAVIDAQSVEIKTMRGWLLVWYQVDYTPMPMSHMMGMMGGMNMGGMRMGGQPMATPDPHSGHGGHGGAAKMPDDPPMMMGMMAGLSALTGTAYEVAWLEAMIDHHDDALHMSERILKTAQHAELKALAEAIIKAQTEEIALMESMIKEIGG